MCTCLCITGVSSSEYLIQIDKRFRNSEINFYDKSKYIVRAYSNQIQMASFGLMEGIDTCNYNFNNYEYNRLSASQPSTDHRKNMETKLILGCNNDKICQYYWKLRCIIADIYKNDSSLEKQDYQQRVYNVLNYPYDKRLLQASENMFNYDYIGSMLSSTICQYLFNYWDDIDNHKNRYNYQIRCFANSSFQSKDGMLHGQQCWSSVMRNNAITQSLCLGTLNVMNYLHINMSCDLCNIGIHSNDWIFQCSGNGSRQHDYCLRCTYTMANEIMKFEKYLDNIIRQYIDENFTADCVKILVTFVVGYAEIRSNAKQLSNFELKGKHSDNNQ